MNVFQPLNLCVMAGSEAQGFLIFFLLWRCLFCSKNYRGSSKHVETYSLFALAFSSIQIFNSKLCDIFMLLTG